MKVLSLTLLATIAVVVILTAEDAQAATCGDKGKGKLKQFNGRTNDITIPCKYYAIKKQDCGDYRITLSPGNVWLRKLYYLNTIWLEVVDIDSKEKWEGRTTNKRVVKYFNDDGKRDLFTKKVGTLETSEVFEMGRVENEGPTAYIKDRKGNFKLTIKAWDPNKDNAYKIPSYTFECFESLSGDNSFADQVCGADDKVRLEDRAKDVYGLSKSHRSFATYYDVFSSDVVQVDDECKEAVNIFQNECPDNKERRMLVMKNCAEILLKRRHTECVTAYQCSPMQAFNSCLKWGCTGPEAFMKNETKLCHAVGEAIDLCADITGPGNITARMKDTNCFTDFVLAKDD